MRRARDIHHEDDGELSLLAVARDEGSIHPRRHVPVDVPHIVSRKVLAHLVELHPFPLESALVLPGEYVAHEVARADLHPFYPRDELFVEAVRGPHSLTAR